MDHFLAFTDVVVDGAEQMEMELVTGIIDSRLQTVIVITTI
jgi:hypothetical protein